MLHLANSNCKFISPAPFLFLFFLRPRASQQTTGDMQPLLFRIDRSVVLFSKDCATFSSETAIPRFWNRDRKARLFRSPFFFFHQDEPLLCRTILEAASVTLLAHS
ncbi:hypothetical protein BC940DRAFT_302436 [Gongronella butleri]|nr:hypothetical protein BC940DRAFT_302436 [Gongronella butleri]